MSENSNQAIWDTAIYTFPYPLQKLQEKAGSLKSASDKFALAYMEHYSLRQASVNPTSIKNVTIYSYWQDGQFYIEAEILPSFKMSENTAFSQSNGYMGKYNPRSQDWHFAIRN